MAEFDKDFETWLEREVAEFFTPGIIYRLVVQLGRARCLGSTIQQVKTSLTQIRAVGLEAWLIARLPKSTGPRSNAESSTPAPASGMSSRNSETRSIFTVSLQRCSTASPWTRLSQLNGALASSLNCLVAMAQEDPPLCAQPGQALMGQLCISVTNKGLLHVTYTEAPICESAEKAECGTQPEPCSGISGKDTTSAGPE